MHVQYSTVQYNNTLINILRFTETHVLTCYRPTMEWNGSPPAPRVQMPLRSRRAGMTSYMDTARAAMLGSD